MVDELAAKRAAGLRAVIIACVLGTVMTACAGAGIGDIPPLRPDLPDDLRQPTNPAPDFRLPPPEPPAGTKSAGEQAETMSELETLRDSHEKNTQRSIERR